MKKYTKQQIIDERISIAPTHDQEKFERICKLFGGKPFWAKTHHYLRFYPRLDIINDKRGYNPDSYLDLNSAVKSTLEITYDQIDFEQEYTLTDLTKGKVALVNDVPVEDLRRILKYCFPEYKTVPKGNSKLYYAFIDGKWDSGIATDLPTQSGKLFLKQLNEMEQKEITGYKITKPEYKEVAFLIGDKNIPKQVSNTSQMFENDILSKHAVVSIKNLQDAGVFDLWFTPIYKSSNKIVSVGGKFDVVIRDGKIWHFNDDITDFVKYVVKCIALNHSMSGYKLVVKDIIFSKTGCENQETKLSDWVKLYEEFEKN